MDKHIICFFEDYTRPLLLTENDSTINTHTLLSFNLICQASEIIVNRLSDYHLHSFGKHSGHMPLQWQSANVITVDYAL